MDVFCDGGYHIFLHTTYPPIQKCCYERIQSYQKNTTQPPKYYLLFGLWFTIAFLFSQVLAWFGILQKHQNYHDPI